MHCKVTDPMMHVGKPETEFHNGSWKVYWSQTWKWSLVCLFSLHLLLLLELEAKVNKLKKERCLWVCSVTVFSIDSTDYNKVFFFFTCSVIAFNFLQRCSETRSVLQSQPAPEGAKQIPAGCHQSPGGKVTSSSTTQYISGLAKTALERPATSMFPGSMQEGVIVVLC